MMPTPSILVATWTTGYSASLGKWSSKNSPINQFAVWSPMDVEACSQLLAVIRFIDDPPMASGLR